MPRKVWRHRITRAGQVSIPAEVRARWAATTVAIEDEGDRLVLRPTPDDPIEAFRGILKGKARSDISSDEAMRIADESERRAERRKWGEHSSSTRSR